MYLVNYGQIKTMEVPDDWATEEKRSDYWAGPSQLEMRHASLSDVELSVFSMGRPLPDAVSDHLQNVLADEPHELTEDEIAEIFIVLRSHADTEAFEPRSIHTADLNGKRVLVIEGFWKKSGLRSYGVVATGNDHETSDLQEIYYMAPADMYELVQATAMQAINSIVWRSGPDDLIEADDIEEDAENFGDEPEEP